jgi:hypothetical protein
MMLCVNITVHDATDNAKRSISWGVGCDVGCEEGETGAIVSVKDRCFHVRETPAEIAALVAAAERKQARERIAAMALQGYLANSRIDRWLPHEYAGQAAQTADALLDALAAREGA